MLENMATGQLKGVLARLPTEKMIREWRKQMEDLIKADKSKKTLRSCAPKWPKLEEYVKNWITDHRKNGIGVSTKMTLIEARRLAIEMSTTDFAGTTSWCGGFMRRNGLCMRTKTTIVQKLPHEYKRTIRGKRGSPAIFFV